MSTLKTHNLQSPDAGGVNIALAPNAGMVVAGLSTYSNQINVGSNIKLGSAGVVTATSFVGSGANLTSIPAANLTGALPIINGSNLTGISGFATALSSTQNTFLNECFKTTQAFTIPNGTQIDITNNETTSGKTVFTRLGRISVATGATFHVSAGTTFIMNVLGVFP